MSWTKCVMCGSEPGWRVMVTMNSLLYNVWLIPFVPSSQATNQRIAQIGTVYREYLEKTRYYSENGVPEDTERRSGSTHSTCRNVSQVQRLSCVPGTL